MKTDKPTPKTKVPTGGKPAPKPAQAPNQPKQPVKPTSPPAPKSPSPKR